MGRRLLYGARRSPGSASLPGANPPLPCLSARVRPFGRPVRAESNPQLPAREAERWKKRKGYWENIHRHARCYVLSRLHPKSVIIGNFVFPLRALIRSRLGIRISNPSARGGMRRTEKNTPPADSQNNPHRAETGSGSRVFLFRTSTFFSISWKHPDRDPERIREQTGKSEVDPKPRDDAKRLSEAAGNPENLDGHD